MKSLTQKKQCSCSDLSTMASLAGGCACGGLVGCKCGSSECEKCGVTTMVRPRFFPGQLLVDGDLQLLVDYTSLKHRLHNRFLHGAGVVCGLQVGCHPCGGGKVVVTPGMALDCCGNDIIVPCPAELDIISMIRNLRLSLQPGYDCGDPCDKNADPKDPRKNKLSYCLWVRYCEEMTDPIAPYQTDDRCSSITCQPSRVREGYSFELRCSEKDDPSDTVWDRILCCIGDLELADRAAGDANALSYFSNQTAFASHQIKTKAPVPFDAVDMEVLSEGTKRLEPFSGKKFSASKSAELSSEIDIRLGLDDIQTTASAVVRWDLQSNQSKNLLGENLHGADAQVEAARAAVQAAAPVLASAAGTQLTSERDRILARESTAQALQWTQKDTTITEADTVQRQYFAYNAWYSPAALVTQSDAMTQLRDWLLQAIDKRGLFGDCKLRDEVLKIQIPTNSNDPDSMRGPSLRLVSAFLRYLIDCICAALNPPCPPCTDTAVKLACLDVEDCEVVKICNLERTYVLTGLAFRYWIPFLHQIGELFEYICCKFELKLKPQRPEPGPPLVFAERKTVYYQQTAPASRVLDDQPAISMLLRLANIEPGAAKLATNFGGSTISALQNQPAFERTRRFNVLRDVEIPLFGGREQAVEENELSRLQSQIGELNREMHTLKQKLSRMEKTK